MKQHFTLLIFIVIFLLCFEILTCGTVRLQYGNQDVIDCVFSGYPYCYGSQEKGLIVYYGSGINWENYYVKIPLTWFSDSMTIVSRAVIKIYLEDNPGFDDPYQLTVNRLAQPMLASYRTSVGNISAPTHYNSPNYDTVNIAGNYSGWIEIDMTDLVRGWISKEFPNDGFLVRLLNQTQNFGTILYESSYHEETMRPILEITGPSLPDTLIGSALPFTPTSWYSPTATTDNLNTVFFLDSLNGWIGGSLYSSGVPGVIRKTTDGGSVWVSQTIPVTEGIEKIVFLTPNIGFAVSILGPNGTILKTTDSGTTWISKRSCPGLFSIFFLNSQNGWACGADTVFYTTDQGETWAASSVPGAQYLQDVAFRNSQEGWAVGLYGSCYKSTNGGYSWSSVTAPIFGSSLLGVCFPTSTTGIIVGGNQIVRSTDSGNSWNTVYDSGDNQLISVSFPDSLHGWAAGSHRIVKTTNGGATWQAQTYQPDGYLNAIYAVDRSHVWAVGFQLILKTTDGGGVTSVHLSDYTLPHHIELYQNYPNPFNPTTTINYQLPNDNYVKLKVYDVIGREVATLVDEVKNAGYYNVRFNASKLSSGIYIYKIQVGEFSMVKKLILLK